MAKSKTAVPETTGGRTAGNQSAERKPPGRRTFGQLILRGTTWYVRTRLRGVTRIQKVGPEKRVAEDLLADLQAKLAREEVLGIQEVAPATLQEVWDLIEKSRRARLTPRAFEVQTGVIGIPPLDLAIENRKLGRPTGLVFVEGDAAAKDRDSHPHLRAMNQGCRVAPALQEGFFRHQRPSERHEIPLVGLRRAEVDRPEGTDRLVGHSVVSFRSHSRPACW